MGLNAKQKAFIDYYILTGMNATRAALKAGYSEKTAYSQGSRLLKNVEIKEEIARRLDETAMKADEVLVRLTQIARGDMDDLVNESGDLDLKKARENGSIALLRKLKRRQIPTKEGVIDEVEWELLDQQSALNTLSKIHDLSNNVNVETNVKLYTNVSPDDWDE